jgi:acid phosphatase
VLGGTTPSIAAATPAATTPPRPAHIVIVMDENHSPAALGADAPYLASLTAGGASFPNAYAVTHPSQPNYLALFSGATQGVTDDSCPQSFHAPNLASQLAAHGRTFVGYAESMPSDGYTGCRSGVYARKHNPWVDFANVKPAANRRFTRFPTDFDQLPTVSWVVPNLCSDMHDCPVATGDKWLRKNLGAYAKWAKTHNSLLIVTFDEAEDGVANKVPLVIYGASVAPGVYRTKVDHYSVLRLIESLNGLPCLAKACGAKPITGIWR